MELTENLVSLPGGEILFARLATNLLELGEVEEATKICEKGLKKFPTYAQAHYVLAKCYLSKNMTDEARSEFERVLRYDPNHLNAIKNLSEIHFANGFQDLYKEYLVKLYILDPLNEEILSEIRDLKEHGEIAHLHTAPVTETSAVESASETEITDKKEEVFLEADTKMYTPADKDQSKRVDLSQFDNLEDDFTTILHGNIENIVDQPYSNEEIDLDLVNGDESVFEKPEEKESVNNEEIDETMDELVGDDEELVIQRQNTDETDKDQIQDKNGVVELDQDIDIVEPSLEAETSTTPGQVTEEDHAVESESRDDLQLDPAYEKVAHQFEANGTESSSEQPIQVGEEKESPEINDLQIEDEEDEKFEQPKIITQTLGEILVSQKKYVEAKSVFEALKEKQPENKSLDIKLAYLDKIIGLENQE